MPPSEPNSLELSSSIPTEISPLLSFENSSGSESTYPFREKGYGDVTSEFEKLPTYESGFNDFKKLSGSEKIYQKSGFGKICEKTNELNLEGDKIDNELEKPLKKVQNKEEVSDKNKKINESSVKNGDGREDEIYTPRTPSMAERRKLFELRKKETDEKDIFDGISGSKSSDSLDDDPLERGSNQRSSIAGISF